MKRMVGRTLAWLLFCLVLVAPQLSLGNETCHPTLECPSETEGGIHWPATPADGVAYVPCRPGTFGRISRKCKRDGTWSEHLNYGCSKCPRLTFHNVHWPEGNVDSMVEGNCASCYVGKPEMFCFANATWSYKVQNPSQLLKCPAVLERGVLWPETACTDTITLPCNNRTYGTLTRTCKRNKWGHITGTCARCMSNVFEHAKFPNSNVNKFTYGKCLEGYEGHPKRFCYANATWADTVVSPCKKIPCPEKIEFGATWPSTLTQGVIRGHCLPGSSGEITRECHKGVWSKTVHGKCVHDHPTTSHGHCPTQPQPTPHCHA
jgi:hypothetical protein